MHPSKTDQHRALKKVVLYWILMVLVLNSGRSADVKGPYFGQTPPGTNPVVFAPGILSMPNRLEARIAFSPDLKECYFTVTDSTFSNPRLYYTTCVNGTWTSQQLTPFLPGSSKNEPFFSADGNKLYFTSNANGTRDLWVVQRTAQGWGTPQVLPSPINSNSYMEYFYSETTDGTVYFVSTRPGKGGTDLWRTRPGLPLQVENLGAPVNTGNFEYDPCVAPDGSWLIFCANRFGGNNFDLYASRSNGSGGWTTPVSMDTFGAGYNTSASEYGPSFSPDGRYLFFVRNNNGQTGDVFWVLNPFAPRLAISLNATNVNLSWSTNSPALVLESVNQLGESWTSVPGVTGYSATLPVNARNQFFRLKK
jgi:Tol biopolymer transport system component